VWDYDYQKEVDGETYSYKLEYTTSKGESITQTRTFDDETKQQVDRYEATYVDGVVEVRNAVRNPPDLTYVSRKDYPDGSYW